MYMYMNPLESEDHDDMIIMSMVPSLQLFFDNVLNQIHVFPQFGSVASVGHSTVMFFPILNLSSQERPCRRRVGFEV